MEDCCDNILVCGTTDNHAAVTGTYSLVISFHGDNLSRSVTISMVRIRYNQG